MEYVTEKQIWEPLSHHTVVHNVTQARPGWSVAPTSFQGRKQESCHLYYLFFRYLVQENLTTFDGIHYNGKM